MQNLKKKQSKAYLKFEKVSKIRKKTHLKSI